MGGGVPSEKAWKDLFADAPSPPQAVTAVTYHRNWSTASKPALLECDDGHLYVVKGRQNRKMIVSDRLVGLLGALIEAPVGEVILVDVTPSLIALERGLAHFAPGISHGNRFIEGCTDREKSLILVEENRPRFAALAILYGWTDPGDRQFIYSKSDPQLVYSVDHGHFFPGSATDWKTMDLDKASNPARPHEEFVRAASLTTQDLRAAARPLDQVSNQAIAGVVQSIPDDWPFDDAERVAVAEFFATRRDQIVEYLDGLEE